MVIEVRVWKLTSCRTDMVDTLPSIGILLQMLPKECRMAQRMYWERNKCTKRSLKDACYSHIVVQQNDG